MLLLRILFRTLIAGLVTRLLGRAFPILRRLIRLIWR